MFAMTLARSGSDTLCVVMYRYVGDDRYVRTLRGIPILSTKTTLTQARDVTRSLVLFHNQFFTIKGHTFYL